MKKYDRSIKIAFDKISGEILDADEVLGITKDAFEIRRMYHEKSLNLSCCECEQALMVSGSKYDRVHFKHKQGHTYCILSDGRLTPQEHEKVTEILKQKESSRHKELKNKIGELLKTVSGVDVNSIAIDNKFIIKNNDKRRPDVYCKFQDKELVFEIQLSDLSLGYILSRYEFYKKHGIYLIWILDNFNIHDQGTLERDIKYLTKYENFFKLDENAETLKFVCEYKCPYLTVDNKVWTKWEERSVTLNELHFDSEIFQIYYYNFGDNKINMENLQRKKAEEIAEIEKKWIEEEKLVRSQRKADQIITNIAKYRKKKIQDFTPIINTLDEMDEFEISILNKTLNFKGKNKPPIIKWIDETNIDDVSFLKFIINTNKIEIDINKTDGDGKTAFQAILLNHNIYDTVPIRKHYALPVIRSLFKAGYRLTESDNLALSKLQNEDKELIDEIQIYRFCNNLKDRSLVSDVFNHSKLLFIIESARKKDIIGYNFTGNKWISFANNAIHHYSEYWEYIELAFKRYGLWDILIKQDKKGTFQKKIESFYSEKKEQKYDFDKVFNDLYSELLL